MKEEKVEVSQVKEFLIKVRSEKENIDQNKIEEWRTGFSQIYKNTSEQWEEITGDFLLPDSFDKFEDITTSQYLKTIPDYPISKLLFIEYIGIDKFDSYIWYGQLSKESMSLIYNCLFLLKTVEISTIPLVMGEKENFKNKVIGVLAKYPFSLAQIYMDEPEIIKIDESKCEICGLLSIESHKLKIDSFQNRNTIYETLSCFFDNNKTETDHMAETLKKIFGNDSEYLCKLLVGAVNGISIKTLQKLVDKWLTCEKNILWKTEYEVLILNLKEGDCFFKDEKFRVLACHYSFSSEKISEKFISEFGNFLDPNRLEELANDGEAFFPLWANFLPIKHGFEFFWKFLFAKTKSKKDSFIQLESLESRLNSALCLIQKYQMNREMRHKDEASFENHKKWKSWHDLFYPFWSLIESQEAYSYGGGMSFFEEHWTRQNEAIQILEENPDLIESTVKGLLDHGSEHWHKFDPIILGLPKELTKTALESYVLEKVDHKKYYHAQRLLHHVEGELPDLLLFETPGQNFVLNTAETYFKLSRSGLAKGRSSIWLGDMAIESLWLGAIKNAMQEFSQDFDASFKETDEHRFVHSLLESLKRNLMNTNKAVKEWIADYTKISGFINISYRELPSHAGKNAPLGGEPGTGADFAVLMKCDIPELALSDRVTFIQVKKASKSDSGKIFLDLSSKEIKQMQTLLKTSEHSYYLFLFETNENKDHLILPARIVNDIVKAQNHKRKIPKPMILRTGESFDTFFLYDIIGLWIGDTDQEKIKILREDEGERGKGPKYVLEITVSNKKNENK